MEIKRGDQIVYVGDKASDSYKFGSAHKALHSWPRIYIIQKLEHVAKGSWVTLEGVEGRFNLINFDLYSEFIKGKHKQYRSILEPFEISKS